MHKLTYFIAAVYTGLKLRRNRRDPYTSIVGTIIYSCVVLLLTINSLLSTINKYIIPESLEGTVTFIIAICVSLALLTHVLLPEKRLSKIEVDEVVAKSYASKYLVGFMVITLFMLCVIVITSVKHH
jgi:hypothetical protein